MSVFTKDLTTILKNKDVEALDKLLSEKPYDKFKQDQKDAIFASACATDNIEIAKCFLDHGFILSSDLVNTEEWYDINYEMKQFMLKNMVIDKWISYGLAKCVRNNNKKEMQILLDYGANINFICEMGISLGHYVNNDDMINFIVGKGYRNFSNDLRSIIINQNNSYLLFNSRYEYAKWIINAFIKHGFNLNDAIASFENGLICLLSVRDKKMLEILIEYGYNSFDRDLEIAVNWYSDSGFKKSYVELFLECGAKPTDDLIESCENKEIKDMLIKAKENQIMIKFAGKQT